MSEVQEVGSHSTFLPDQQRPQQAQQFGGKRQCSIEDDEASTELENHRSSSSPVHSIYNTSSTLASEKTENTDKNTHNLEKQNKKPSIIEPTPLYISCVIFTIFIKISRKNQ